ncbi:MAG TPA: hypothetical protein VJ695_01285 [Nitrososphaera sp.]|nr:hypothetical protein [Nitrososphaera sp.]
MYKFYSRDSSSVASSDTTDALAIIELIVGVIGICRTREGNKYETTIIEAHERDIVAIRITCQQY